MKNLLKPIVKLKLDRARIEVPTLNRMTKKELEALNRLLGGKASEEDRKLLESSLEIV